MKDFEQFLSRLFDAGQVIFHAPPERVADPPGGAVRLLSRVFEGYRLEVAGPLLPLDSGLACEAGELLRQACWALVSRGESAEQWKRRLTMRRPPRTPAEHLSADLLFRYLPQVHRRARAIDPEDPVTRLLTELLRQWPLSGVLADIDEPPLADLDFGDHHGLLLRYAERLVDHDRPSWRPERGRLVEYIEWVQQDRKPRLSPRRPLAGAGTSREGYADA